MANPYYNYSGSFIPGTLARAESVGAEFSAVATGFARLSTQGIDTGTQNVVVFSTTGYPVASYQDGNNVQFKALFTNSGPATINVNGLGAVPLLRFNGNSLVAGDISSGSWYIAVYQAAFGGFTILSPAAYATSTSTVSNSAPSHLVGLTPAGGSATAVAPIDVTFAIDQSIAPTWTGLHTFNGKIVVGAPSTGVAVTITGVAGASALKINTTGMQVGSPTGGDQGAGTINVSGGYYVNGTAVVTGAVVTSIAAGTGIGVSGATGAVTVTNNGVTSITGTANEIAASASTGAVTLSLPANVVVPTPVSGNALTVNTVSGSFTVQLNAPASVNAIIAMSANNGGTASYIGTSGGASGIVTGDAANDLGLRSAGSINFATNNSAARVGYFDGTGNLNISNGVGLSPVYAGIPQNSQGGSYTCVLADANKQIKATGGGSTITIPSNASVAYPIGTALTFVCFSGGSAITIAINTDTMNWASGGASGSRTLANAGVATALKVAATNWIISGAGLT